MAGVDLLLTGVGYSPPTVESTVWRLAERDGDMETVTLAEEVPVALVYNGRSHAVVMCTPLDLEDLAAGFSVTEGIVGDATGLERVEVVRASHGIELQIQIPMSRHERLSERSRTLMARTACGLCGIETINDAMRVPEHVIHSLDISRDALFLAAQDLGARQTINNETSTVHAAAWANQFGEIQLVREDVGRHNALDKLFGAMLRTSTPIRDGFVVITSRASYEMVQKAAVCGVEILAAVSRPTGLAVRFAQQTGVTLVALLRGRSANVYANPQRIS